jgi:hypothetical protein
MTSTWIIFTLISLASGLGLGYMLGKSKREYIPVEASEEPAEVYIDTTKITLDSAMVQSEKKYMETQLRIKLETDEACSRINEENNRKLKAHDMKRFKEIIDNVK